MCEKNIIGVWCLNKTVGCFGSKVCESKFVSVYI